MLTCLQKLKIHRAFYQTWYEHIKEVGFINENGKNNLTLDLERMHSSITLGTTIFQSVDHTDINTGMVRCIEEYLVEGFVLRVISYYSCMILVTYKIEITPLNGSPGFSGIFNYTRGVKDVYGIGGIVNIFSRLNKDIYNVSTPVIHDVNTIVDMYNRLNQHGMFANHIFVNDVVNFSSLDDIVRYGHYTVTTDYLYHLVKPEIDNKFIYENKSIMNNEGDLYESIFPITDVRCNFMNQLDYISLMDWVNYIYTTSFCVEIVGGNNHGVDIRMLYYKNSCNHNFKINELHYNRDVQTITYIYEKFMEHPRMTTILASEEFKTPVRITMILSNNNEFQLVIYNDTVPVVSIYYDLTLMNLVSLGFASNVVGNPQNLF